LYLKRSFLALALVPFGVVTVTFTVPFVPAGESAVNEVAELTFRFEAPAAPNLTAVAPVKFVPVIVTGVPPVAGPVFGESFLTVGEGPTGTIVY
jgi:hypothetical protein